MNPTLDLLNLLETPMAFCKPFRVVLSVEITVPDFDGVGDHAVFPEDDCLIEKNDGIVGIESVGTEQVAVQLSSPLRPGLLRPVDGDDFSYLVMPIRLNV